MIVVAKKYICVATVRPFNVTMATAPKSYAVSQAMHSGAENNTKDEVVFCC